MHGLIPAALMGQNLAALVGDVAETMRPLAEVKGLTLHVETHEPVSVYADAAWHAPRNFCPTACRRCRAWNS